MNKLEKSSVNIPQSLNLFMEKHEDVFIQNQNLWVCGEPVSDIVKFNLSNKTKDINFFEKKYKNYNILIIDKELGTHTNKSQKKISLVNKIFELFSGEVKKINIQVLPDIMLYFSTRDFNSQEALINNDWFIYSDSLKDSLDKDIKEDYDVENKIQEILRFSNNQKFTKLVSSLKKLGFIKKL